jgi:hypothetical protein
MRCSLAGKSCNALGVIRRLAEVALCVPLYIQLFRESALRTAANG